MLQEKRHAELAEASLPLRCKSNPMRNLLAWRMYPEPDGTNYYEEDLDTEEKVEHLFDYCQILEASVFDEGWKFLLHRYGIKTLYEINERSGWYDVTDADDFQLYLPAHLFDK
ncbi:hypothetical protein [Hymenobacter armeniacus]|uniref:Uncharacterized protein n=1 Tax=Hymenobacter armeniacus TaxID=2771358 RepID=A0ABR8JS33_9BACT|nr:hypothetical protein [Hymenobacter armeniacus]MBD2722127.1 hypothetical protein [Hymenobacter armeniacus]